MKGRYVLWLGLLILLAGLVVRWFILNWHTLTSGEIILIGFVYTVVSGLFAATRGNSDSAQKAWFFCPICWVVEIPLIAIGFINKTADKYLTTKSKEDNERL